MKVDGDVVSISEVEEPGDYTGQVNLVPANAAGPKTTISFKVRDNWIWPAVILALGLVIAIMMERWLTRWRPRKQLSSAIWRLKQQVTDATTLANKKLQPLRKPPAAEWRAPLLYDSDTSDPSLLNDVGARVERGLRNALGDGERTEFGADGTQMDKVETLVDGYSDVLEYGLRAAGALKGLLDLSGNNAAAESGALADRVSNFLNGSTITDEAALSTLQAQSKELAEVAAGVGALDASYRRLAQVAADNDNTKIAKQREQLLGTVATVTALNSQLQRYTELSNNIYQPEPAVVSEHAESMRQLADTGVYVLREQEIAGARIELDLPRPSFAPPRTNPVVTTAKTKGDWLRRHLALEDTVFSVVSGIFVFATGFSALYLVNETFGSLNDYVGVLTWGAVGQGSLSLIRRLIPGGIKSPAGGS